jgi:hypothetical protein
VSAAGGAGGTGLTAGAGTPRFSAVIAAPTVPERGVMMPRLWPMFGPEITTSGAAPHVAGASTSMP